MPQCRVLIAKPGISVSTKLVYENLNINARSRDCHPDIDGMIQAIQKQDLLGVAKKFGNVLELVTAEKYPVIEEIKAVMKKNGALNALMSGSGPTVFGLFTDERAAQKAYEELRYGSLASLAKQVYLTNLFNRR